MSALSALVLSVAVAMPSTGRPATAGAPPGGTTPGGAGPALIGSENAATEAMAALRGEIDAIAREPASAARDARMALRRMAFDLLFHGGADLEAQAGTVAGLRLSALRAEVDARLSMPPREGLSPEAIDAPLARFASAASAIVPGPAAGAPSPAVPEALGHLVAAIALLDGEAQRPAPWPVAAELARSSTVQPAARQDGSPGAAGVMDPEAARARIVAVEVRALRADARSLAADLVRAAARSPADGEIAAIDADLRRLQALPEWVDGAAAAKASLRGRFDATTRAWVKSLHEPTRRAQARSAMARFESERAAIGELPLEAALRRGDPAALERAAGRAADVLAAIDRVRAAWYEGWLDGRGDPARTAGALRLVRALAAVEAATQGMGGGAADRTLAAWGGWPWVGDVPRIPERGLVARAELALTAVLAGEDEAADRQLGMLDLELPPATLERTLRERLAPWSRGRSGLAHRLAAAAASPGPDAWLGGRRAELCAVARLLAEASRARARDDAALADALRRDIAVRARSIASAP